MKFDSLWKILNFPISRFQCPKELSSRLCAFLFFNFGSKFKSRFGPKFGSFFGILFLCLMFGCLPAKQSINKQSGEIKGFKGAEFATSLSHESLSVHWTPPLPEQNVGGIEILELTSTFKLKIIGSVPPGLSQFEHRGLKPDTTHTYIVRALFNDGKKDHNFNIVSATTQFPYETNTDLLSIFPQNITMKRGTVQNFLGAGGKPHYSFAVILGPGIIEPKTGEFIASGGVGLSTVQLTDSEGETTFTTVQVVSGFEVQPKYKQLLVHRSVQISTTNAVPPVKYQLTSGQDLATLSPQGLLTAELPGVVNVKVTDSTGLSEGVVIVIVDQLFPHSLISMGLGSDSLCYSGGGRENIQCYGNINHGQIGNVPHYFVGDESGEMGYNLNPVNLGSDLVPTRLAVGENASCALFSNNKVKCWGDWLSLATGLNESQGSSPLNLGDNLAYARISDSQGVQNIFGGIASQHFCAILANNTLKCWGSNSQGQLGLNNRRAEYGVHSNSVGDQLPLVAFSQGVKSVALGEGFTCAILQDDKVRCWGLNSSGQLGYGNKALLGLSAGDVQGSMATVLGSQKFKALDAGANHICGILKGGSLDGKVKCWGNNNLGKLGYGHNLNLGDNRGEMNSLDVVNLGPRYRAIQIALGLNHSCALLSDGSVKCWGKIEAIGLNKTFGPGLGDEPGEVNGTNTQVNLGQSAGGVPLTVQQIVSGRDSNCAVFTNGNVKCWGKSNKGLLGLGPMKGRGFSQMGDFLPYVDLGAGLGVQTMAMGNKHACALLDNDTVKCWGQSSSFALGHGRNFIGDRPGETPVESDLGFKIKKLVSGSSFACALSNIGTMKCWGQNSSGQLGSGDFLNGGAGLNPLDGKYKNINLGFTETIQDVALGHSHGCAILSPGRVKCWGSREYGQLGNQSNNSLGKASSEVGDGLPYVDLGPDSLQAIQIGAGFGTSCALFNNGRMKCWGLNSRGQLGYGDRRDRGDQPGSMGENLGFIDLGINPQTRLPHRVKQFSQSRNFVCALLEIGKIKCWGSNSFGQLGYGDRRDRGDQPGSMGESLPYLDLGSDTGQPIQVAVSSIGTCVLFSREKVKCFGNGEVTGSESMTTLLAGNNLPYIDLGQSASVVQLFTGPMSKNFCAVLGDASVKCWGSNEGGSLGRGNLSVVGNTPRSMGDFLPTLFSF